MNEYRPYPNVGGPRPQDVTSAQEAAARMFGDVKIATKRTPAVASALDHIEKASAALQERLRALQDRLTAVVRPEGPLAAPEKSATQNPSCEVAVRIEGIADRLNSLNAQMASLLGRLEV